MLHSFYLSVWDMVRMLSTNLYNRIYVMLELEFSMQTKKFGWRSFCLFDVSVQINISFLI